jgi:oligopeptide transport system substrate-binding protein
MLRNKQLLVLLSIVLLVTTVLSGCSRGQALAKELNYNLYTEPPTIDPALSTDTTSVQCVELLFLGLTDFDDETLEVIPELATEWSASADGLTWTFKMRDDVSWVHYDPATKKVTKQRPVTAHDVVYGVQRTLNPETASDYAYVDYIIKNAEAVNTGESTDLDSIGVRAIDDYTVEFTLEQAAGYFPGIAGMWVNRPQPREAIEAGGDTWTEPGTIWTNGPYVLDTWEHENRMVMMKNPEYYDAEDVSIEQVNFFMVNEDSTAFAMYENGELDVANAPLDDIDRIKADATLSEELYIAPSLCTYYYGFNTTKPPFDNPLVRQAFSYAVDRQKLIDTVTKGEQRPAKSLACPGIFGSVADNDDFVGISFDPDKAKELLTEAGYPDGQGLPEVTLMFNTSEGHQKIAEFMQQSWKENLGVEVKLANQEWAVYLDTLDEDAPQIYRNGWCADYPDANNWLLEVFHPTKSQNNPKWDPASPGAQAYMKAVEDAAASSDPDERQALYFEAEKILTVDEAIIIPIYYYTSVVCTKPYVERSYAPLGGEHIDKWKVLAH